MSSEKFIIDTDTLITPYRLFYPFDMFPDFWDCVEQKIKTGEIKILDMVYKEISEGGDQLSDWLSAIGDIGQIERKDSTVIAHYGNILNYINTSPLYKVEALNSWAKTSTADPWLIAAALAHSYTVITFEKSNAGLNANQPSKDAKIPDICRQFNVKCESLYYMTRQVGFRRNVKSK